MKNFNFLKIILVVLALAGCQETARKPLQINLEKTEDLPAQEIWNGEIYIIEESEIKAKVLAEYIASFPDKKETYLKNATIFFFRNGEVESILRAKKGLIDDKTKNMTAYDSVFAQNLKDSVNLYAKDLSWVENEKKIYSKNFVRIENIKEKEVVEGYGFEANQDLSFYTIFNVTYQSQNRSSKALIK